MGGGVGGYFRGTRGSEETTTTENSMPTKSKPNSKMKKVDKDGKTISERMYDNEERAEKDIDYRNYGNSKNHPKVPHTHKWDWSNPDKPIRGRYDE